MTTADELSSDSQSYRVIETSRIPDPKKSTYPDCLIHILRQPISAAGSPPAQPVDLVFTAFRNRTLYPASNLKTGDGVTLFTIPFHEADANIQAMMHANDLPFSDASILFVHKWTAQETLFPQPPSSNSKQTPFPSNRDLIIQTLTAHQGNITGGLIQGFFFWTHVPAMYKSKFWEVQTTRKGALDPLKTITLFNLHLADKNIKLVFVPIPSIHHTLSRHCHQYRIRSQN